jgi:hypothetical protein
LGLGIFQQGGCNLDDALDETGGFRGFAALDPQFFQDFVRFPPVTQIEKIDGV